MKTRLVFLFALLVVSEANNRPPPSQRKFRSAVVDATIEDFKSRMIDPDLADLFENCLPNTLDTTVENFDPSTPDTFVITGDIPASWLRDSTNQVFPYLRFASKEANLATMIKGVIGRQVRSVLIDPYANAFQFNSSRPGPNSNDYRVPRMQNAIFEGKYELDSIANVLRLSNAYLEATNDTSIMTSEWHTAMLSIINTIKYFQQPSAATQPSKYQFSRVTSVPTDTLLHQVGPPGAATGMSRTCFRPSDDASTLPFLVPANAMTAVELEKLAGHLSGSPTTAAAATLLAHQIRDGIRTFARVTRGSDQVYAYEVDGFGSSYTMDDANLPSLLALPFLGFCDPSDPVYTATRRAILSRSNPYYASGKYASGIGSPHTYTGWVWPMALIMQARTSTDEDEIMDLLEAIKASSAGTGFMHESFDPSNPSSFTRPWFAWANSQLGELILHLADNFPHLIFKGEEP